MVCGVSASSIARRVLRSAALPGLALLLSVAACGSATERGPLAAGGGADPHMSCPEAVLDTLGRVVRRVYREGVASERTGSVTPRRSERASTAGSTRRTPPSDTDRSTSVTKPKSRSMVMLEKTRTPKPMMAVIPEATLQRVPRRFQA